MNVTLSGEEPKFERWRFTCSEGVVAIFDDLGAQTNAPNGLATALVRALGEEPPEGEPQERRIEADQTNVSVIVADRWIVKLIVGWGTADRSALIEDRLAATAGYAGNDAVVVPPFLGAVRWERPGHGESTVALVSQFVSGAEDGWTWAPDDVIAALPRRDPEWPRALGEQTASMHLALADSEFPHDSGEETPSDVTVTALWEEVAERYATRDDVTGARMRNRLGAIRDALRGAAAPTTSPAIVIHGDLHVGQVLRDESGKYYIVDFDGDPQWGGSRPWRRLPAARDVAHMLVSIDLVAAVAQKRTQQVDSAFFAWADRACEAFLTSYTAGLAAAGKQQLFDASQLEWLRAEQLLLELRYAAFYLPVWEFAPDAVITHRYRSNAHESETPWTPPVSSTT